MSETCSATLKHSHGRSTCALDPGHAEMHEGYCWTCHEDDFHNKRLSWHGMEEDWTKPRGSDQ